MSGQAGKVSWIPLLEYASKHGVSLSTLRRHIKANKVIYKTENGRYLLLDDGEDSAPSVRDSQSVELLRQLQKANEEIAELKTLIAFYEERAVQPTVDV